jgi:hypothetical protein
VSVNDTEGNVLWAFLIVNVTDTTAPTWDEPLSNQTIEVGTDDEYDVNASDIGGIDKYNINDTSNFDIDASNGNITNATALSVGEYHLNVSVNDTSGNVFIDEYDINDTTNFNMNANNGNITNATALSVGEYHLNVSVNDTEGNVLWTFLIVNVTDTVAPTWDQPLSNQTIEFGLNFSYDTNASDLSGIDEYDVNDTTNFNMDASNGNLTNATALAIGEYHLNVSVNDTEGNVLWAFLIVNVTDTTAPTWDEPPMT